MNGWKIILIFISLHFYIGEINGQLNVDSLKKQCTLSDDPTEAFNKIQDTLFYFFSNDITKAKKLLPYLKYYDNLVGDDKSRGLYYQNYGYYKNYISQLDSAVYYLEKSLFYFKKDTSAEGLSTVKYAYNAIALIYDDAGLYKTSIENHLKCIEIAENIEKKNNTGNSTKRFLAAAYNDIAQTYSNIDDTTHANYYFNKSIDYAKEHNLNLIIASNQFNYGVYLLDLSEYDKAFELFEESKNTLCYNDTSSLIVVYLNETKILIHQKKYNEALSLCQKTISISKEKGYPQFVCNAKLVLSNIYQMMGDIDNAITYGIEYENLCHKLINPKLVKSAEMNLVDLYSLKSDYESAFKHQKEYIQISDSLSKADISEKVSNLTLQFNLQKQVSENKLLLAKNQMNVLKIKTQKLNNIILSISSFILLIILIFLWLYYNKSRKTNAKLAELNNELIEKKNSLNEINSIQQNLFAVISHDLKGPIGTAKSFFDILNSPKLDISNEEKDDYIKIIGKTISSSYDLLENILFWSKNRLSQSLIEMEIFHPYVAINDVIKNIDNTLFTKKITIKNNTDPQIQLYSCLTIFMVVIRNLITNAIKFTPKGGFIDIFLEEDEENMIINVKDSGVGMSADRLKKIFNAKNKISTPGTENEHGTGLGLIISKELIEKLGGKIWVVSEPNKGSTFSFSIKKQA